MIRIRRPRRPSAAIVISLIALFFAMSGTAVAATGGDFLLGKSNTATNVTRLTNTTGTALSVTAAPTSPPLRVSNSSLIPNLNASYVGNIPASGFVQGGGTDVDARVALNGGSSHNFLETSQAIVDAYCDVAGTGASLTFSSATGDSAQVIWWNKDGASNITFGGHTETVTVSPVSEAPYMVAVQMDTGSSITTYTLTQQYDSVSNSCYFTGQAILTNG
jgi:hypothetical protein